jgi:hypothetical protein
VPYAFHEISSNVIETRSHRTGSVHVDSPRRDGQIRNVHNDAWDRAPKLRVPSGSTDASLSSGITARLVALIGWSPRNKGLSGPACVVGGIAGCEDLLQQEGVASVDSDSGAPTDLAVGAFTVIGQPVPHCIVVCAACQQGTEARSGEAVSASASTLATSFIRRFIPVNLIFCSVNDSVCDLDHILDDSSRAESESRFS